MATRSVIGYKKEGEDKVKAVYSHFDGYLEGVGLNLLKHFNDENKVKQLVKGDIRAIDDNGFVDYFEEEDEDSLEYIYNDFVQKSSKGFWDNEFTYLYIKGEWYFSDVYGDKKFKKVKDNVEYKPEDSMTQEDLRRGIMRITHTLLHSQDIKNFGKEGKYNKVLVNKIRDNVMSFNKEVISKGYKYYPIDRRNNLLNRSNELILLSDTGDYVKLYGYDVRTVLKEFNYIEVYSNGMLYQVKINDKGDDLKIMYKTLKRKPNNINALVNKVYGK